MIDMAAVPRWRASVCKRRLRPLASKIAAYQTRLREYRTRQTAARWNESTLQSLHEEQHLRPALSSSCGSPSVHPAWTKPQSYQKIRRRAKMKYRARQPKLKSSSQPRERSTDEEEIRLTTPYLQRHPPQIGSHYPSSPVPPVHTKSLDLDRQSPSSSSRYIQSCFLELMVSTCKPKPSEHSQVKLLEEPTGPRVGVRSLLKTCLRQVPAHMLDEQLYRLSLNPDDRSDVYDETYEDLERFDLDTGWQNQIMRRVARAHAIQMYLNLVNDSSVSATALLGLLTPQVLGLLTPDEIDEMLHNWMTASISARSTTITHNYFQRRTLPEPFNVLSQLQYLLRIKHPTLTYRVLTKLVANGSLKVEEIGHSELHKIWRGALKSITMRTTESNAAMLLVETALSVAAGVCPDSATEQHLQRGGEPSTFFLRSQLDWANIDFEDAHEQCYTALVNTVSSICTLLSASTIIARSSTCQNLSSEICGSEHCLRPLRSAAAVISKAYKSLSFVNKAKRTGFPLTAAIIVLADLQATRQTDGLNLHQEQKVAQELRVWTFQNLRKLAGSYVFAMSEVDDRLADLLHATSKCLRRATPPVDEGAMHTPLRPIGAGVIARDYLVTIKRISELEGRAVQTHNRCNTRVPLSETRGHPQRSRNGFRWEDGLEEWIAITPRNPLLDKTMTKESSPSGSEGKPIGTGLDESSVRGKLNATTVYSSDHHMANENVLQASNQNDFQSSPPMKVATPESEDTEDELAGFESPSMFRAIPSRQITSAEISQRRARPSRHI